jgi:predicted nucleic acid-binding protein
MTSVVSSPIAGAEVYLVDTDVISEMRKGESANPGVREFFARASREAWDLYLSAITIGELRQGVERIRHRGDAAQAKRLERWLGQVTTTHGRAILSFDQECAQIWGRLRVPNPENPLDKQIAATALMHDLAVVTRNTAHYTPTGVRLLNPFV